MDKIPQNIVALRRDAMELAPGANLARLGCCLDALIRESMSAGSQGCAARMPRASGWEDDAIAEIQGEASAGVEGPPADLPADLLPRAAVPDHEPRSWVWNVAALAALWLFIGGCAALIFWGFGLLELLAC